MKQKLLSKIKHKEITVGVVGLGYVGLPLAVEFKPLGIILKATADVATSTAKSSRFRWKR